MMGNYGYFVDQGLSPSFLLPWINFELSSERKELICTPNITRLLHRTCMRRSAEGGIKLSFLLRDDGLTLHFDYNLSHDDSKIIPEWFDRQIVSANDSSRKRDSMREGKWSGSQIHVLEEAKQWNELANAFCVLTKSVSPFLTEVSPHPALALDLSSDFSRWNLNRLNPIPRMFGIPAETSATRYPVTQSGSAGVLTKRAIKVYAFVNSRSDRAARWSAAILDRLLGLIKRHQRVLRCPAKWFVYRRPGSRPFGPIVPSFRQKSCSGLRALPGIPDTFLIGPPTDTQQRSPFRLRFTGKPSLFPFHRSWSIGDGSAMKRLASERNKKRCVMAQLLGCSWEGRKPRLRNCLHARREADFRIRALPRLDAIRGRRTRREREREREGRLAQRAKDEKVHVIAPLVASLALSAAPRLQPGSSALCKHRMDV